ncbi:MAG: fused response regulator/phosphatase [Pseudomonadales bacterium]|nr:fused response regulator/phosphatase [Pseudomonadales bacterium]
MMEPITVLVADDNDSDRLILCSILKKQGHEVIQAANGQEAVDLFSEHRPNLVLLDALMPELDGFEAARLIKALAGEDLIPIMFLTSLKDATSLAKCLDAGGDDFLSKPYNRVILGAKIHAFQRMRQMHQTLQKQRDQIARNNTYLLQEQRVAKAVFDNVAHSGCLDAPNIKHLLSPLAVFNGDVLLAAYKPSGGMHILLGDFTGHGLPAAIGAMPLAEIFYGMTAKGFGMTDILREINMRLKSILPIGVFCCAGMVEISYRKRTLSVWLGGLPDCYLIRKDGLIDVLKSNHLPIGVLKSKDFDASTIDFQLELGDRFYLWSDGIHEARNEHNKMYGEERLMDIFVTNQDRDLLFSSIKNDVAEYIRFGARDDDITMLELTMVASESVQADKFTLEMGAITGPTDWSMTYSLGPGTLKDFNPLPLLLHLLMEVPGLRPHSGTLYTVLAELYSNALEHGVIGLCSDLKTNPSGFREYYQLRKAGLDDLTEGYVKFRFEHTSTEEGGLLRFFVEDSGAGFEYKNEEHSELNQEFHEENLHGRGIQLLKTLCSDVRFHGVGNEVEATFEWQREA